MSRADAAWQGVPRQGEVIGDKYLVQGLIGSGGMGVVLAAEHLGLRTRVAVKLLLPQAMAIPGAVDRFVREARAAAMLTSPHVARVPAKAPSRVLSRGASALVVIVVRTVLTSAAPPPPDPAVARPPAQDIAAPPLPAPIASEAPSAQASGEPTVSAAPAAPPDDAPHPPSGEAPQASPAASSSPREAPGPTASAVATARTGTLNINSIPVSKIILDGRPLGQTPKIGIPVDPGRHVVSFILPDRRMKTVTVEVGPGRTQTASTRF